MSGEDKITVFHARIRHEKTGAVVESPGERRFCSVCGSALWVWDPRWLNGTSAMDWIYECTGRALSVSLA